MAQLVVAAPPLMHSDLEPHDKKYNCCCDSCHVKTGTQLIGIVEAVGLFINLFWASANFSQLEGKYPAQFVVGLIASIIWLSIIAVMFYGLAKKKHSYLVPHLIVQVFGIVCLFIGAILSIVLLATGGGSLAVMVGKYGEESKQSSVAEGVVAMAAVLLLLYVVSAALEIWFFTVVLNCYRYLRELHYARKYQQPAVATYGQPIVAAPAPYPVAPQYYQAQPQ